MRLARLDAVLVVVSAIKLDAGLAHQLETFRMDLRHMEYCIIFVNFTPQIDRCDCDSIHHPRTLTERPCPYDASRGPRD